jgi:hypothetical protein
MRNRRNQAVFVCRALCVTELRERMREQSVRRSSVRVARLSLLVRLGRRGRLRSGSRCIWHTWTNPVMNDGVRGSRSYALGCVLVQSSHWAATFDQVIAFRRFVRSRFNIPVRAEIKANYLLRNGGPLRQTPLSERARFGLYRGIMRIQPKLGKHLRSCNRQGRGSREVRGGASVLGYRLGILASALGAELPRRRSPHRA